MSTDPAATPPTDHPNDAVPFLATVGRPWSIVCQEWALGLLPPIAPSPGVST
jgi:hypothetical protein